MKKKCLFIMIPIIIMLAFTGKESVISVKAETRDDYSYELKEDGSYTITGYNGSENEVVIPNKINGKKVTSIGDSAFEGCSNLTSITIPKGVTSIGDWAFYGCSNLTSVTIPKGVTSIGRGAFDDTKWLENEQKKNALVIVNNILIDGSTANGKVTIPKGVTSIGDGAFYKCRNLTSITIPKGVTSIGNWAFDGCSNLTIYGEENSVVERYANERGINFIIE